MAFYSLRQISSLFMVAVVGMSLSSTNARAEYIFSDLIDFEQFDIGQEIAAGLTGTRINQFATVFVTNKSTGSGANDFNSGAIYDSEATNGPGADSDLERFGDETYGWSGGSLADPDLADGDPLYNGPVSVGKLLMVQENGTAGSKDKDVDGNFVTPNDEGGGGTIRLVFDIVLQEFRFDWIDFEENGSFIDFFLDGTKVATVQFFDFLERSKVAAGNLAAKDASIWGARFENQYTADGDNFANRLLVTSDLLETEFDEIVFDMAGSGGIDNIFYIGIVPEPTTAALLSLLGLGLLRRRRRSA